MKKFSQLSALCASALIAATSSLQAGQIIAPTSVVSNTFGDFSGLTTTSLINQSGLSLGYTSGVTDFATYIAANPTHASSSVSPGPGWASPSNNIVTGTMIFDLGATYTLLGLALWADTDEQSVGSFSMDISGTSSFSSFTSLGSFSATDFNAPVPVQVFNFTAGTGQYVRWNILGTVANGMNLVQAGEIAFNSTPGSASVPDSGATVALLGGALVGLAALRRRLFRA